MEDSVRPRAPEKSPGVPCACAERTGTTSGSDDGLHRSAPTKHMQRRLKTQLDGACRPCVTSFIFWPDDAPLLSPKSYLHRRWR